MLRKDNNIPNVTMRLDDLVNTLEVERHSYIRIHTVDLLDAIWQTFY